MTYILLENGQIADADQVMGNFYSNKILEIDETTDLDISRSANTIGSATGSKTYSFIGSELENSDYLEVEMNGDFRAYNASGGANEAASASVTVIFDRTSGTPATLKSLTAVDVPTLPDNDQYEFNRTKVVKYYYLLTDTDKTDGLDFKITINANTGSSVNNGTSSYTNSQIVFRAIN